MATKSKSIDGNIFKGLISWLCLLALLCGLCLAVVLSIIVLANPDLQTRAAANLQEFAGSDSPYYGGVVIEAIEGKSEEDDTLWAAAMDAQKQHEELIYMRTVQIVCALAILLTALVLVFAFRRDRRRFEALMAKGMGKLWVEIKCLLLGAILFSGMVFLTEEGLVFSLCLWVLSLYLLCMDIGYNRQFFRHNIIHSVLKWLNSYKGMTTFEHRSLRRLFSTLGVIAGILAVAAAALIWAPNHLYYAAGPVLGSMMVSIVVFAITGVVGTIVWYVLGLKRDLQDWNALMAQITEMYGGNLNAVNHVPPTSNLYDCAMQLNMIRTGIEKAVEEGTKADRTKVELITNVSHDIKTPLTSIISYIELLKKEPDLPDHVMDYISTISRKAERLSSIVQDVFEVSKAATGNITLNMEDLDIGKLLQQTFGEMDETLRNSQLIWRIDIPDVPMLVHADGQRLYRVFQNLIRNCDQYALEGSRAYVSLSSQNGCAVVSIRNVSRNEITMDSEDLTARFVRGDQNRTTEGSGLGLSIAKSFTEACGGQFSVRTDGDLFIATVQFVQINRAPVPSAPLPPPPQEAPLPPAGYAAPRG